MAKKKQGAKERDESSMQDELLETANNIWLAGLGALSRVEREGEKLFNSLVERGAAMESRGRRQAERAGEAAEERAQTAKARAASVRRRVESTAEELGSAIDERLRAAMQRLNVPTRGEIRALSDRVAELTAKVEQLKKQPAGSGARKTSASAKKTTKRTTKKTAKKPATQPKSGAKSKSPRSKSSKG